LDFEGENGTGRVTSGETQRNAGQLTTKTIEHFSGGKNLFTNNSNLRLTLNDDSID